MTASQRMMEAIKKLKEENARLRSSLALQIEENKSLKADSGLIVRERQAKRIAVLEDVLSRARDWVGDTPVLTGEEEEVRALTDDIDAALGSGEKE